MKERLQGLVAGVMIGAVGLGGVVYATTGTKSIDVLYDNIKVYKDNVLCELKDANGTTIEPFIYNGTTFMPVRGTANLADMQVTWDGSTKSVYLWDNMVPDGTFLLDVCQPYDTSYDVETYLASKGKSFKMAGEKYSNGLSFKYRNSYALFNLNSNYSNIECVIGHTEGGEQNDSSISFVLDGKVVKTVELEKECLPKKVSIPVNYGLQLKIVSGEDFNQNVGVANITIR